MLIEISIADEGKGGSVDIILQFKGVVGCQESNGIGIMAGLIRSKTSPASLKAGKLIVVDQKPAVNCTPGICTDILSLLELKICPEKIVTALLHEYLRRIPINRPLKNHASVDYQIIKTKGFPCGC